MLCSTTTFIHTEQRAVGTLIFKPRESTLGNMQEKKVRAVSTQPSSYLWRTYSTHSPHTTQTQG